MRRNEKRFAVSEEAALQHGEGEACGDDIERDSHAPGREEIDLKVKETMRIERALMEFIVDNEYEVCFDEFEARKRRLSCTAMEKNHLCVY